MYGYQLIKGKRYRSRNIKRSSRIGLEVEIA
jgi:hypothetical protein